MVIIRQIACELGVSLSTVSAVVNNKGIVGRKLTDRVHWAIEAMGFHPHAVAPGLRNGCTHIIGMETV